MSNFTLTQLEAQIQEREKDLADLQSQVEARRSDASSQLTSLQEFRQTVNERLDGFENTLKQILGGEQSSSSSQNQAKRKVDKKFDKKLEDCIASVLTSSNGPLTATEIADLVIAVGYPLTTKANLCSMIYGCIKTHPERFRKTTRKARPARFSVRA